MYLRRISHWIRTTGVCRWVWRQFTRWNLTNKNCKFWCIRKFTFANVAYYLVYISEVLLLPLLSLKYLDEASFEEKSLRQRKGWSACGQRLAVQSPYSRSPTYTVFCLTNLQHPTGFRLSIPRTGANTGHDFLKFFLLQIISGNLTAGDHLILDNAPIHTSRKVLPIASTLAAMVGFRLVFLPKYSPELNPVELIWARVKNHLRSRRGVLSFGAEMLLAFSNITHGDIVSDYEHCLLNFDG